MDLSYSAVSTAYTCYRKYELVYKLGEKAPVAHSADMSFGTGMHAGLQACLEGDNGLSVFDAYWQSEKGKELSYGRYGWDELHNLGITLQTRFERLHAKYYKIHQMEQRLFGDLGGVKIAGTPDFLGDYQGVPSVVDFKTSAYPYPYEKLDVNEQMYLYAYLAQQNGYTPKQIVYAVFIKSACRIQVIKKDLTNGEVAEKLKNIQLMLEDLTLRESFPMNRNSCLKGAYLCEFYQRCYPQPSSSSPLLPGPGAPLTSGV